MTISEQVLTALKTKFEGVEEPILKRIADNKSKGETDESKVQSIVDGINFADVVQSYGDFRADEASKSAVRNYEKKFALKNGAPVEPKDDKKPEPKDDKKADPKEAPADDPKKPTETPPKQDKPQGLSADEVKAMFQQLLEETQKPLQESISALQADNKAMKDEKAAADFRARVAAAAKANNIPDTYLQYLSTPQGTDEELDAYMKGFAQLQADNKFAGGGAPDHGEQEEEKQEQALIDAITAGTKEMVQKQNA